MRSIKDSLKKIVLNVITRLNNPMVHDEFFVPKLGLTVDSYIKKGDRTGSHHLLRYEWAIKSIATLGPYAELLDVACGAGYGSYMLAKHFPQAKITGVDYDPLAIKKATATYQLPNLTFRQGDLTRWDETIGSSQFSCITSFDTFEHVNHRDIAMQNLVNHLDKEGCLLFSTPCGEDANNLHPIWAYHKIEFSSSSLYDFLKRYFNRVISSEDANFIHKDVFKKLEGSTVTYSLRMNPVICLEPIHISYPYRSTKDDFLKNS